jgi:enoyl-CoA hydratase
MGEPTVMLDKRGDITVMTMNRPESLNAISREMVEEIETALAEVQDDPGCRVLVLTGAGDAFCAGMDIGLMDAMGPIEARDLISRLLASIITLEYMRQPVIAAINGACFGGGLELALGCTLRVACESARLGLPEARIGLIPGAGGVERLPRVIGLGRASEMIMTGKTVTARWAHDVGLVNEVCSDDETVARAEKLAAKMLANAPLAVEATKRCLYSTRDLPLERGAEYSLQECCLLFDTADKKEGARAFLEKREPRFTGE